MDSRNEVQRKRSLYRAKTLEQCRHNLTHCVTNVDQQTTESARTYISPVSAYHLNENH